MMNILNHVDFAKLCHVINFPPELNSFCVKEGITFTIYSSSRDIERQKYS